MAAGSSPQHSAECQPGSSALPTTGAPTTVSGYVFQSDNREEIMEKRGEVGRVGQVRQFGAVGRRSMTDNRVNERRK